MTDARVQWDALTYDGSTPARSAPSLHVFLKPDDPEGEGAARAQSLFQKLVSRFYAGPPHLAPREKLADAVRHAIGEEAEADESAPAGIRIGVAVVDPLDREIHVYREGEIVLYLSGEELRLTEGRGFETIDAGDLDGFAILDGSLASEGIRSVGARGERNGGRLMSSTSTVGVWVPLGEREGGGSREILDTQTFEVPFRAAPPRAAPPLVHPDAPISPPSEGPLFVDFPPEAPPSPEPPPRAADAPTPEPLPSEAASAVLPEPREIAAPPARRGPRLLPVALLLLVVVAGYFGLRNRAGDGGEGRPEPIAVEEGGGTPPAGLPEPEPAEPVTPAGTLAWEFRAGAAVTSSPLVAGDLVLFGSRDGKLYALDRKTGARVWTASGPGGIGSSPAAGGGAIYFGEYGGALVAVSDKDGREIWRRPTAGRIVSSPYYHEGRLYVGSFDRHLYAIGAESGAVLWRRQTGGVIWASPVVSGDLVLFGSWDGSVYALRSADGGVVWRRETGDRVYSSPVVLGDEVYIGTQGGALLRLDRATGSVVWTSRVGSPVHSRPTIAEDRVLFGSEDGNVHCAYRETGEILWSFPTGARVPSTPRVDRAMVYVASYDEFLYALDLDLGHPAWRTHLGASVYSSPTSYADKLYVGTNQGRFLAVSLGG